MNILTLNLLFSTLIFAIAAWIYVRPILRIYDVKTLLIPILLLHTFRHLGLMFLERGGTLLGMPPEFAIPAAYGDFLASTLALIALFALLRNSKFSLLLVWIFNIEGTLDLLLAIALATKYEAVHFMGAAYWIPALWVPALLVTHFITFRLLLDRQKLEIAAERD
jgi:hypothetical protein